MNFVISSTLERGFSFPLIMFIVNIFEYIQVFFPLSYRTLTAFVKTIDCCFGKIVVLVRSTCLSNPGGGYSLLWPIRGGSAFLINPPSGNVKIQKMIAKHIFECFDKRKGEDGKATLGLN